MASHLRILNCLLVILLCSLSEDSDSYAKSLDARIYVPDFFAGTHMPFDYWSNDEVRMDPSFNLMGFLAANGRTIRLPSVLQAAQNIKSLPGVEKLGAVGVNKSTFYLSQQIVLLGRIVFSAIGISFRTGESSGHRSSCVY